MSLPVADAAARAAALDIRRSFCVQAPAGSGKTELLTQRILNLLAHAERPEEILAFTFTRKAAAEMRARLLNSLQEAAAVPAATRASLPAHAQTTLRLADAVLARDADRGWHLLASSQRLRINTIDSFTSFLTGQLPLAAGFGARPEISTDMREVFAQAIHATLARLDGGGPFAAPLAHFLQHLHGDLARAESLLASLLGKREQWLPLVVAMGGAPDGARAVLEANLRALLDAKLELAGAALAPWWPRIQPLLAFAAANLAAEGNTALLDQDFGALPAAAADAVAAWRALASFFLVKDLGGFRRRLSVKEGFPAASATKDAQKKALFDGMKNEFAAVAAELEGHGRLALLRELALLPDPRYGAAQWEVLSALTAILPLLAAELDVAMRAAGQIDHTQTTLAALQALGGELEPTDLALRLDYRIRHILVDEFQDTSSMQFQLLEKLTAGWQEGDGRTLFIVGDGMQSCYAFRNANVGLFLRARDQGIGSVRLEDLRLQVNFRSDRAVVDWVNAVFARAFPPDDDIARGGVCYSPSVARDPVAHTAGVACRFLVDGNEEKTATGARRALEAEAVARLCGELVAAHPGESIAILVRTRSHLDAIVPALRAAGLRWNASEIDQLLSYPDIGDLFTLLRALLNLADLTAWFALLRTPFVGLELADIERLAEDARANERSLWSTLRSHAELPALSADARARLARCVPHLERARAQRQVLPLRSLLEALWVDLGGPACLEDAAALGNVATFLALVEAHARHGDLPDIHAFEEQLQACYGSSGDPAAPLQIMTIHKAKGLEFDNVILPGLDRTTQSDRLELLLWKEFLDAGSHSRPLLAALHGKGGEEEPLYRYLRFDMAERADLETTRLCYIAVTRAAERAWLFGTLRDGKQGLCAPAGSLLETILPALLAQRDTLDVVLEPLPPPDIPVPPPRDTGATLQAYRRLPAGWRSPLPQPLLPEAAAPAPESDAEELLARRIGELVHLGLKQLVEQGEGWLAGATALPFWTRALRPHCDGEAALQQALATVRTHLAHCLEAPEADWLFRTAHRESACELALADYTSGQRHLSIVDRTFVDADGRRWIVDYKASRPGPHQTLAAFLAAQAALYLPQLRGYARLLRRPGEPPPRVALFFTGLPHLHELELDANDAAPV